MARVRSPNYPVISLVDAIKLMALIQAEEQHLAAPKEVVAKHIGFSTLHGGAGRVISALENYGLLDEVSDDKVKVSPLAMSILFPSTPEEKQKAISEAAIKHPLFAAIAQEWEGARPSDANLRVYLIRRKFAADALDRVIEVYKETMDLVTLDSGGYAPANNGPKEQQEKPPMHTQQGQQAGGRVTPPPAPVGPMRVSFNGDQLEVSAVLSDAEAVDRLVKALQANKALLPEKPPVAAKADLDEMTK